MEEFRLPEGWFAELDRRTGRYYFWNKHTKERSWVPPPGSLLRSGAQSGAGQALQHVSIPTNRSGSIGSEDSLGSPSSSGARSPSGAFLALHLRTDGAPLVQEPLSPKVPFGELSLSGDREIKNVHSFASAGHSLTAVPPHGALARMPSSDMQVDDDGSDPGGFAATKRQRAPTDSQSIGEISVGSSGELSSLASDCEGEEGHKSRGSASGKEGGPSSATDTGGSGEKKAPPRKSKLKDLMSMIHKKTPFARDKKRRENVIAERSMSVEPHSAAQSGSPSLVQVYPKSPQVKALLVSILQGSYVFGGLSGEELSRVADMMSMEEVRAEQTLIQQGDRGDFFYCVEQGTFDVLVSEQVKQQPGSPPAEASFHGNKQVSPPPPPHTSNGAAVKKVGQITKGGAFGELALLYGQQRAATVRAVSAAVVWKLDRHAFRGMLRSAAKHDIEEAKTALRSVPLLSVLTDEQISSCADVVRFKEFPAGCEIIVKGEIGDVFYIIKSGQVQVSGGESLVRGESQAPFTLGPHSFFGERALLKDEVRAANVTAVTNVTCLVLDRIAFTTILGPLREVLDNNIRVSVFKQLELFQNLSVGELSKIANSLVIQSFQPGETILRQGDTGTSFYIMRSGECTVAQKVILKEQNNKEVTNTVSTLHTGDYFGEMALLNAGSAAPGTREASVIATQPCECFVLDRSSFERLLGQTTESVLKRNVSRRREENAQRHRAAILLHQRQQSYEQQQREMLEHVSAMEVDPMRLIRKTNYRKEDFEHIKTLGTGTFGRVQLARHRRTGETYALKVQSKAQITKYKLQQNIINEKLVLAMLHHPFIIALHQTFQDRDCLYMLLELVQGGELFGFLQNYGPNLQKPHHIFYVANIVSAFAYLHSKSILYRDLKPENILIDATGYLKLVDFGFAKIERHKTFTLCGTPEYFSPELVLGRGYGAGNDVWGIGILTFEVICGFTPFGGPDDNSNEVCKRVVRQPLVFPEDFKDEVAKQLIGLLLRKDPVKRLGGGVRGMEEVKEHLWFKYVNWEDLDNKRIEAPWVPTIKNPVDASLFDDYDENFEVQPYLEEGAAAQWAIAF